MRNLNKIIEEFVIRIRDVINFRNSHFCTNAKNTILIIKTPGGMLIRGVGVVY